MIDPTVPWVLLRVREQLFGVPASHIREMAEMPAVTRVPNMPEYVMGLVSLRGQVTPTIDMRRRLGVATAEDDIKRLVDGLARAEAEHRLLAETLSGLVQDGRGAGVDVCACAFQGWLGELKTKNPLVRLHLKKLEEPHARLHALAARVVQTVETDPLEAKAALHQFQEKELAAFLRLLPQVRERLIRAHRQIVVVLTLDGVSLGAAVDEVESIERLKNGSIEELPSNLQGMKTNLTRMVGRRTRDDEIVLILEVEELFHGDGKVPLHGDWMAQAEITPVSASEPEPAIAAPPAPGVVEKSAMPVQDPTAAQTAPAGVGGTIARQAPEHALSIEIGDQVTAARQGYADGMDDRAWCGETSGPWMQIAEGPIVQTPWAMEEAEESGNPGSPWM
jgi:chemotaxis signal transduction protein